MSDNGKKGTPKGFKTLVLLLWLIFATTLDFLYGAYVVVPQLAAGTDTMMTWVKWIILTVMLIFIGILLMLSKLAMKIVGKVEDYIEGE
jgi:hypothetical protein